MKTFRFLPFIIACVLLSTSSARANVYATDIRVNGNLNSAISTFGLPVQISYRLNQAATLGVTVGVWQGANPVATITGGTNMGLNAVLWGGTNNSGAAVGLGTYSFTVTAAASGFTNWEQISADTNAGNFAYNPNGMAVDNNTNSPYYGRVVVGCSSDGGVNPVTGAATLDGIYKMNADGSFAEEGGFGYGNFTKDDHGFSSSGEMPDDAGYVPWRLRIGEDDRIYMLDYSLAGAIIAFDMRVTTNQIVIDDGHFAGGQLSGPHNYSGNPDFSDIYSGTYGINNFDVTSTTTTNAAVWLCGGDSPPSGPNWGIWMYRLKNGASDVNDIVGTQAVTTGGDLSLGSTGGCSVDSNLDIFCGQSQPGENAAYNAMDFANWHGGVLPPEAGGTNYTLGTTAGAVLWGYGCGVGTTCANDPTFEAVQDIVINSRSNPTIVACPTGAGNDDTSGSGIRLLSATDASVILTNLDFGQAYSCAAWDNMGNLYGASPTLHLWRAWSPPGANTNTTVAQAQVTLEWVTITGITAVPKTGYSAVTVAFTASGNPASSVFNVVGSSTVNGVYTNVSGATITPVSGGFQAGFTNAVTEFYKIKRTAP